MASNGPDSFFVPQTPTPTKTEKAAWEIDDQVKATAWYKALMESSSDSDTNVQMVKKMIPEDSKLPPPGYNSDDSVEIMNAHEVEAFQKKMSEKNQVFDEVSKPGNDRLFALQLHESERINAKLRHSKDKAVKEIRKQAQMDQPNRLRNFVPNFVDHRILFVRDTFVGVENYLRLRAVDRFGTVYKRAVLKDKSVSPNFIMTSTHIMFKLDGEMVEFKTPGARGIVNITRENRVSYRKLYDQTFENEFP